MDAMAASQENGETPAECIEQLAEKYDLERIDMTPYGLHTL